MNLPRIHGTRWYFMRGESRCNHLAMRSGHAHVHAHVCKRIRVCARVHVRTHAQHTPLDLRQTTARLPYQFISIISIIVMLITTVIAQVTDAYAVNY